MADNVIGRVFKIHTRNNIEITLSFRVIEVSKLRNPPFLKGSVTLGFYCT